MARAMGGEGRVNYRECEHLGGLPAVALPEAIWLPNSRGVIAGAVPALCRTGWITRDSAATAKLSVPRVPQRGVNAPLASSCGRLETTVAAALRCAPASLAMRVRSPARWSARWPLNALTLISGNDAA